VAKPISGRTILENENGQARLEAYSFQQETTFELAQLVSQISVVLMTHSGGFEHFYDI
jgi:hypothetical protein